MPPGWFLCLTRCVFSIFHPHQSALCSFMHLLLIVNASTNFLIYCFMGNKFKTVLLAMVRELVKGKEQVGRHGKCVSFGTKTFCLGKITTKKNLCRWEPALSSWQTKPLGSRETSQRYTITIILTARRVMMSSIVLRQRRWHWQLLRFLHGTTRIWATRWLLNNQQMELIQ